MTFIASGFTDTGLSAATQYCYRVRVFDAALNRSDFSDEECVTTPPLSPPSDTAAPVSSATPAGGNYTAAQTVALGCDDGAGAGCAAIYYTVDGGEPSTLSSVYTQPFVINKGTTLRFFAVDQAGNAEVQKQVLPVVQGPGGMSGLYKGIVDGQPFATLNSDLAA
jgi:hypothetical protein